MPTSGNSSSADRRYMLLAFRIIGEFGLTIAVPVVVLAVLGKRLDEAYGTAPWLRIAGFATAAGITAVIINRRARALGREYEAIGAAVVPPKTDAPR